MLLVTRLLVAYTDPPPLRILLRSGDCSDFGMFVCVYRSEIVQNYHLDFQWGLYSGTSTANFLDTGTVRSEIVEYFHRKNR